MKIALTLIATVMASPVPPTSDDIVIPLVELIDSSYTCSSFQASIQRSPNREKWTKAPRQNIYQKNNCLGAVTYDANFCTLVCQLDEGDQCQPDPSFGDDVCDTGLFCNDIRICQSFFDLYDYSSSSGFIDDLLKTLYDEPMSHSRRKHTK